MLEANQLSFRYAKSIVFQDATLQLQPGEMVALLGPNGAGKTTLLKIMARQLSPVSGTVLFSGRDIQRMGRHELTKQISLMPQHEQRDASLSVFDVVALGRVPHRGWVMPLNASDREAIASALEATGLTGLRDRSILELSGGEWRRMILARSLAQDATVLLLDEPTAGLDLKYQWECLAKVQSLTHDRKLVTICTLHDLNQAATFADKVAILADEKILVIGSPTEVLTSRWIKQAFGVDVTIVPHPKTGIPLVVSDWEKERSS
jgi:iron complex transport system ATP-binding protein